MTYYLYRCPKTERVVLDSTFPETATLVKTIEAGSWLEARETVDDSQYMHVPGQGWF